MGENALNDNHQAVQSIDGLFRLIHELENRIHARGVVVTEQQRQIEALTDRVEAQGRALSTAQATVQHLLKAAKGRDPQCVTKTVPKRGFAGGKQFQDPEKWEREHLARKERDNERV